MTHLSSILWAWILLCPENLVRSVSDTARWRRPANLWLKAIIATTAASPPPSTFHFRKCDWRKRPGGPSTVPWHTAKGEDSMRGWGRGFQLYWCHCKSLWTAFTLTRNIKVVTIDDVTPAKVTVAQRKVAWHSSKKVNRVHAEFAIEERESRMADSIQIQRCQVITNIYSRTILNSTFWTHLAVFIVYNLCSRGKT